MIKNFILRFLTIPIVLLFLFACSSSTKSNKRTPTVVTISDVWITDAIDIDGDGYNSYLKLNFDLDVNKPDSVEVFVLLGFRVTDPMDTASYYLLFESLDFKIAGSSAADGKYIGIELPNPNNEEYMGVFDFLLEVYYSSDPNTRIVYASESEDADMGGIPMETSQIDVIIYDTWLSYNDGSFEDGYFWQNTTGYLAVRFNQPSGAVSCLIKAIRYHIFANSANVYIRVWDNSGGFPGGYIYYSSSGDEYYLFSNQWNTAYIDIDVSNYDPFFVGYYQYQFDVPLISADETTPLFGRSYYKSFSASSWTNDTGGDYAIEVYVEYTGTSANGKPIVKGEWLSAESY